MKKQKRRLTKKVKEEYEKLKLKNYQEIKLKKIINSNIILVSSKINLELNNLLLKKCRRLNKSVSKFIRALLNKELRGGKK